MQNVTVYVQRSDSWIPRTYYCCYEIQVKNISFIKHSDGRNRYWIPPCYLYNRYPRIFGIRLSMISSIFEQPGSLYQQRNCGQFEAFFTDHVNYIVFLHETSFQGKSLWYGILPWRSLRGSNFHLWWNKKTNERIRACWELDTITISANS